MIRMQPVIPDKFYFIIFDRWQEIYVLINNPVVIDDLNQQFAITF